MTTHWSSPGSKHARFCQELHRIFQPAGGVGFQNSTLGLRVPKTKSTNLLVRQVRTQTSGPEEANAVYRDSAASLRSCYLADLRVYSAALINSSSYLTHTCSWTPKSAFLYTSHRNFPRMPRKFPGSAPREKSVNCVSSPSAFMFEDNSDTRGKLVR